MTALKSCNPWEVYETEVPSRISGGPGNENSIYGKLTAELLQLLRDAFRCHAASARTSQQSNKDQQTRPQTQDKSWNERMVGTKGGAGEDGMNLDEFRKALTCVVGPDISATQAERFFSEVDINCEGRVDWQQLCSFLTRQYTERDRSSKPRDAVLNAEPEIRHCSHKKQEPTVRVVALVHPPPLRYISISRGGQLTVWNSRLHILKTLWLHGDCAEEGVNKGRFRAWTTDAVYMGNVRKVAIATGGRDLHFIDVSTTTISEDVILFGFHKVPTALYYWYDDKAPGRRSLLLWGDDKGGVNLLWFLNPSKGLFENPFNENKGPRRIYMPDLGDHSKAVSYHHFPNVHKEPINRVIFEPSSDLIMTSSESDVTAVVIMHVSFRREPYVWRIDQGVRCFDYSRPLRAVVTGGFDPVVKLWNQFVTARPIATLKGHETTVLDVVIYHPVGQIFSYSKDGELRIWDISSYLCLGTIHLQFPCLQLGPSLEQSNFPFLLVRAPLPGKTQPHLLVACKDYLARLRLTDKGRAGGETGSTSQPPPGAPLSCALYNPSLKQVVTGCNNSSVSVWDVETGKRCLTITNAHGEEAVTCMALDVSHRRLITGAGNGTIKVWDLLNGQNLHKMEPVGSSEVTGVTCLCNNRLLAVGWSRRIAQYDMTAAKDSYVRIVMSWKSKRVYKSDILELCHCPALGVVATASHDGEVIVWRLETQAPHLWLQRDATQSGTAPPVDSLLFLQHRAGGKKWRNGALLVSSQGGSLCFWSLAGHTHPLAQFYGPDQLGERVLALSSDHLNNTLLVSGDTTGCLQVWDISRYALDTMHQPVCEQPPLRCSWKAHEGALLSVEVAEHAGGVFVFTASADGDAGLWTAGGNHVGSFGQEVQWNVADPATYTREIQDQVTEPWMKETDDDEHDDDDDEAEEEESSQRDQSGLSQVKGQSLTSNPASGASPPPSPWHTEPSIKVETRSRAQLHQRAFPVAGMCSPYRALDLQQECQETSPPEDLPSSPWICRQNLWLAGSTEPSSLLKSSSEEGKAHHLNDRWC